MQKANNKHTGIGEKEKLVVYIQSDHYLINAADMDSFLSNWKKEAILDDFYQAAEAFAQTHTDAKLVKMEIKPRRKDEGPYQIIFIKPGETAKQASRRMGFMKIMVNDDGISRTGLTAYLLFFAAIFTLGYSTLLAAVCAVASLGCNIATVIRRKPSVFRFFMLFLSLLLIVAVGMALSLYGWY